MAYSGVRLIAAAVLLCVVALSNDSEAVPGESKNDELIPRILNGQDAVNDQFPFIMGIMRNDWIICGAAIITTKSALSAAHCIYRYRFHEIEGRIGDVDARKAKQVLFLQLITHDEYVYNNETLLNDIGLLIFLVEIDLSDKVQTIALPVKTRIFESGEAVVAGWGYDNETTHDPGILQWVELEIMTRRWCDQYLDNEPESVNTICTLGYQKGASDGDSGCPLQKHTNDDILLCIGVLSAGEKYEEGPDQIERFTATARFEDWIRDNSVGTPVFY